MTSNIINFTLEELKSQAKRLRASLSADGNPINHAKSLEMIASQYGFRDWNTLHAAIGNRAPVAPVVLGQWVNGTYLGQPFEAEVIGVETLSEGRYRLKLDLEEAVDVVTFDSFSAFRKRIACTIGRDGKTVEKTSDGKPQLVLKL